MGGKNQLVTSLAGVNLSFSIGIVYNFSLKVDNEGV